MIIKIDTPGSVQSGKIGGQYIQSIDNVASLRNKRNGGNKFRQYSRPQRGFIQSISKLWGSLLPSEKGTFLNYANQNPVFANLQDTNPLKAYLCFATLNSKLNLAGYSPISSVGRYVPAYDSYLSVSALSQNPFTITGSKYYDFNAGKALMYTQFNLTKPANGQARNVKMVHSLLANNSNIGGFQTAVRQFYPQDLEFANFQCRIELISSNGRIYTIGPLLQFQF